MCMWHSHFAYLDSTAFLLHLSLLIKIMVRSTRNLPSSCCCVASVMSDSVQPHRRQPTKLRCPWDSPGKNTGVGCHFLLQCVKVESESEVDKSCLTLCDPMVCSLPGSSVQGIFQAGYWSGFPLPSPAI